MGNIHVKLYEIWTSGSGGDVLQRKSLRMTEDGRTKDKCDHYTSPLAFSSGELPKCK